MSEDIDVMHLGKIIEYGNMYEIIDDPDHRYTQALTPAVTVVNVRIRRKDISTKGETPQPIDIPKGCRFNPGCPYAFDQCYKEEPE